MKLTFVLLHREELDALLADPTQLDGVPIEPGALPPTVLIDIGLAGIARGEPALWVSFFVFVAEETGSIVGSGGYRGVPRDGRVEIGYGVAEPFRRQGVASACVMRLLEQAFSYREVSEVFAETSVDNLASQRALEKSGRFMRVGERDTVEDGRVIQWLARR